MIRNKFLPALALISLLLLIYVFSRDIAYRPLERWDEQTNIEVVRQSLSDNTFYLTYNDQPFFEKPPLWYFLTMASVNYFGDELLSYRLLSILSSLGIFILSYLLVSKRSGKFKAVCALLAFLFIPQLYTIDPAGYFASHTFSSADLDVLQILFMVFSIFLLFYYEDLSKERITLSYLSLALGYLSKGPLVLLPLILNTLYLHWRGIKIKSIFIYALGFVIPVMIWHIYMQIMFGSEFSSTYIDYHILQRGMVALEGHVEPLWFYLQLFIDPRVNLLALPFLLSVIQYRLSRNRDIFKLYFLLLIILFFLLITLSATRLAWYILPIYPFLIIFLFI